VTGSLKEIQGKIAGVAGVLGGGMLLGSSIQDAMRYESLMATLGESLGASRKDFEKWQATVGRSMGYSRLQSAETASLLSLNFKKIATSQADLTNKTMKMMEVAAVISNKRGMTMQETSDRIRSAMNGEADGANAPAHLNRNVFGKYWTKSVEAKSEKHDIITLWACA